jgi:hypothetical protein
MSISGSEVLDAVARGVTVSDEALSVDLADGRTITVPLAWFPRLSHGTTAERINWRFIGGGVGIHWPDLDEDISVVSLLAGRKSGESQASLRRWLGERRRLKV